MCCQVTCLSMNQSPSTCRCTVVRRKTSTSSWFSRVVHFKKKTLYAGLLRMMCKGWAMHRGLTVGEPTTQCPVGKARQPWTPVDHRNLTYESLQAGGYLDMPLKEAAAALGVSITGLKCRWRRCADAVPRSFIICDGAMPPFSAPPHPPTPPAGDMHTHSPPMAPPLSEVAAELISGRNLTRLLFHFLLPGLQGRGDSPTGRARRWAPSLPPRNTG